MLCGNVESRPIMIDVILILFHDDEKKRDPLDPLAYQTACYEVHPKM